MGEEYHMKKEQKKGKNPEENNELSEDDGDLEGKKLAENGTQLEDDIQMENEDQARIVKSERTPYQKKNYLYFGGDRMGCTMAIPATLEYLNSFGFAHNSLEQAAKSKNITLLEDADYEPDNPDYHYCDFCSAIIKGIEYEVLDSGLERCMRCSKTALRTEKQFVRLFKSARQNMEALFGITLSNIPIMVRMVNAKKIAHYTKTRLKPTPGFDARILGFARRDKDGFALYIESGSPKIAATATMVHEMTHIWQYKNWNDRQLSHAYGSKNLQMLYEGMAMWVEIQYMFYINEIGYGKREWIRESNRDDVYGIGLRLFVERYPFQYTTQIGEETPFCNLKYPL